PGRRRMGPALPTGRGRGAPAVRGPPRLASARPGRTPQPAAYRVAAPPRPGGAGRDAAPGPGRRPRSRRPRRAGRRGQEAARGAAVPAQTPPGGRAQGAVADRGPGRHLVSPEHRVTVVLITRNRRPELIRTLERMTTLPERP